jgi:hypothetical protein
VNLHSGDVMHAHLTYDGTTLTLTLTDTVTNATFTAAQAINIPATVLANTAFVGFTGGTGGNGQYSEYSELDLYVQRIDPTLPLRRRA